MALLRGKKLRQSFILIIFLTVIYPPFLSKKFIFPFSSCFAVSSIYIISISLPKFIERFLRVPYVAVYILKGVQCCIG